MILVTAKFNGETLSFLARDVLVLPIANISVEALAHYLLDRLREHEQIRPIELLFAEMKVSSGSNQWGSARWRPPGSD